MTRQASLIQKECEYTVIDVATDSTTVFTGPVQFIGLYINTVLSAHALPIYDGAVNVLSIPASAAAGTTYTFPGIKFSTSLIVDPNDAATGNITVMWRKVRFD